MQTEATGNSLAMIATDRRAGGRPARPNWWIVLAMAIALGVSGGAVANYALGVMLKDVVRDFSWTRGGASSAISLYFLGMGISVPISGALIDRFGACWPAIGAILCFSAVLLMSSFAGTTGEFRWALFVAGLMTGGTTGIPYAVTISRRFETRRGLALGLGYAGLGLGGLTLPHIIGMLMDQGGWRTAIRGLALLIPVVSLPGAFLTLSRQRAEVLRTNPFGGNDAPWRAKAFWIIALAIALASVGVGGTTVHAVALLTDQGVTAHRAASCLFFMALAMIAGRIGGGYLIDRFDARYVTAAFFLLLPLGVILLLTAPPAAATIAFVCIGLTAGSEANAIAYLSARYLKAARLGSTIGLLQLIFSISNAVGILILGYAYDAYGSYKMGMIVAIVFTITAAAVIIRLGPYPMSAIEGQRG